MQFVLKGKAFKSDCYQHPIGFFKKITSCSKDFRTDCIVSRVHRGEKRKEEEEVKEISVSGWCGKMMEVIQGDRVGWYGQGEDSNHEGE